MLTVPVASRRVCLLTRPGCVWLRRIYRVSRRKRITQSRLFLVDEFLLKRSDPVLAVFPQVGNVAN